MVAERKLITENIRRVLLKEYIRKETEKAGFGGLDIQRTPMGTRITLVAERPGMIIGQRGASIKDLTEVVENRFKFDNPQIEVQEDPNPNLNPHIMAQKLASAIERGWHFRRAGHSTVRRIMESGARGCQVIISGKLTGETKRVLVENRYDEPRQVEVSLQVQVQWLDRQDRLIRESGSIAVPPELVTVGETATATPEVGSSIATAQLQAIHRLAEQIVAMMETPW